MSPNFISEIWSPYLIQVFRFRRFAPLFLIVDGCCGGGSRARGDGQHTVPRGGLLFAPRSSHAASLYGTFSAVGEPLCRFPDMIVNSACAFIPISDLSVTAQTEDISGDSSSQGQDTENGDCPWKPGTSGHPIITNT